MSRMSQIFAQWVRICLKYFQKDLESTEKCVKLELNPIWKHYLQYFLPLYAIWDFHSQTYWYLKFIKNRIIYLQSSTWGSDVRANQIHTQCIQRILGQLCKNIYKHMLSLHIKSVHNASKGTLVNCAKIWAHANQNVQIKSVRNASKGSLVNCTNIFCSIQK